MNINSYFKNWPSLSQWAQILKTLNKKEKIIFITLLFLFLISSIFLAFNFYFKNTELVPVEGGSFIEGMAGYPRYINPIYSELSDVDKSLTEIIFSGLMEYNDSGEIIPDLVEGYEILEQGKVFNISLKENIFWHDGEKITIDDVIFTIKTIQNPDYKSPLRAAWIGIIVEKTSESSMRLKLRNSSAIFLENLTLKIIPKHIWENIQPENFHLSACNLKAIGSGPYQIDKINRDKSGQIKSISLNRNPHYFKEQPKIKEIKFNFYNNEEELMIAVKRNYINNFSILDTDYFNYLEKRNFNFVSFKLPRYFAVFFNVGESDMLKDKDIRKALNYATDKEEIIETIFGKYRQGDIIHSPVLPKLYNLNQPNEIYEFNIEKAKEILDEEGFIFNEETGIREKSVKTETVTEFKSDLKAGSTGNEVKALQKCLSIEPAGGPDVYPDASVTGSFGKKTEEAVINFQEKYAEEILTPNNLTKGTGTVGPSTRKILNELCDLSPVKTINLEISLTTTDQKPLIEVAEILKEQWSKIGIKLNITTFNNQAEERDMIIKNRDYEALLFGATLSLVPDPLPLWHSLQIKDPGYNLSLYENNKVDELLEEIRQETDLETRNEKLVKLQGIIISDVPALFLYNQNYTYITSKKVKGIEEITITDPSKRFSRIEDWYINTKRSWK